MGAGCAADGGRSGAGRRHEQRSWRYHLRPRRDLGCLCELRALDALMHSAGVVNRRPAHLKALKPQLFQWLVTDAVIAWDLFNAWDVTKMSKHRKSLKPCTIT